MPAFAKAQTWAERKGRSKLWFGLLLLMLGCRDGLVLISRGMAIDLMIMPAALAMEIAGNALSSAIGWLLMLSRWLYPLLMDGKRKTNAGKFKFDKIR